MRKIVITTILFCLLFMSSSAIAATSSTVNLVFNGQQLAFDNPPVIESGRTLVPMKLLFEKFGAKVTWNNTERSVSAVKDNLNVKLFIDKKTAYVNGKAIVLDVPAEIRNSRTFIPVSFTAQALGYKVDWIEVKRTVVITSGTNALPINNDRNTSTSTTSQFEQEVAKLINEIRTEAGLKPLTLDSHLSDVARLKSEDLRDKEYFDHQSPTYGSPFDMMEEFNISYSYAGENIAAGQRTPEEVVTAWMNSPGHKANILKKEFTTIGVGYAAGGAYKHYWTQMFTTPRS